MTHSLMSKHSNMGCTCTSTGTAGKWRYRWRRGNRAGTGGSTRSTIHGGSIELHCFWWAYMPICDVQVRPQVMQLKMFTVGFDALAWFFLRVWRSSRLAIRWFS